MFIYNLAYICVATSPPEERGTGASLKLGRVTSRVAVSYQFGSCATVLSIMQLNYTGRRVVPTRTIGLNRPYAVACLKSEVRLSVPLDTLIQKWNIISKPMRPNSVSIRQRSHVIFLLVPHLSVPGIKRWNAGGMLFKQKLVWVKRF